MLYENDYFCTMEEKVVLVDEKDRVIGLMGKTQAHQEGLLHRAISILIQNSKGEMLIQQRAFSKYHWAGIWSNAVCSHPRENETFEAAATRRLKEELGIEMELTKEFSFIYKAVDEQSGLTEHEFDTVFSGIYDGEVHINKEEVENVQWIEMNELEKEIQQAPEKYSFWFKIILEELKIRKQ